MRRFQISIVAMICLLSWQLCAQESPRSVLILPFDSAVKDHKQARLGEGIADLLTAYLAPYSERIQVVDREKLDAVIQEQSLSLQAYLGKITLSSLGHLVQAKFILRGSFTVQRNHLGIQAFLYETETTKLVRSFEVSGSLDQMIPHCEKLAKDLGEFYSAPIQSLPTLKFDDDPQRNLHLIYGLGYFFNGQVEKAMPEFMKILKENPKDADARYWLTRSFHSAGLKEHARLESEHFVKLFSEDARGMELKELLKKEDTNK